MHLIPCKFNLFYKEYKDREFKYLDIGCGNHSATVTKRWFPNCEYHGVDRNNYNNDDADFALMKKFYQIDLEKSDLSEIPDGYFDVIMCAHVIEHLKTGDQLLKNLAKKLAPGGIMYVEFPGKSAMNPPLKLKGTSFYDDPTHVRPFELKEVSSIVRGVGLTVQYEGVRRDAKMIILLPVLYILNTLKRRDTGHLFWDLIGFCEYVLVKRRPSN